MPAEQQHTPLMIVFTPVVGVRKIKLSSDCRQVIYGLNLRGRTLRGLSANGIPSHISQNEIRAHSLTKDDAPRLPLSRHSHSWSLDSIAVGCTDLTSCSLSAIDLSATKGILLLKDTFEKHDCSSAHSTEQHTSQQSQWVKMWAVAWYLRAHAQEFIFLRQDASIELM